MPTILGELRRHFRTHTWVAHVPRGVQERVLSVRQAIEDISAATGRSPTPRELADHIGCRQEGIVDALAALRSRDRQSLEAPIAPGDPDAHTVAERLGDEDPAYGLAEHRDTLRRLLPSLSDREQLIVLLRFHGQLTQREIAERLDLSQMHISRILRAALERL